MATIESLKIKNADGTTSDYAIGAQAENIHYSGSETVSEAILALKNSKANKNHASAGMNYGVGDEENYGHLRISDNYTSTSTSLWEGTAASLYAVHDLYENLKSYIENGSLQLLIQPQSGGGGDSNYPNAFTNYKICGSVSGTVFTASSFTGADTFFNGGNSGVDSCKLYPKMIAITDPSLGQPGGTYQSYILFEVPKDKITENTPLSSLRFVSGGMYDIYSNWKNANSPDDVELGDPITFDFSSNYYGLAGPRFETSHALKLYLYEK